MKGCGLRFGVGLLICLSTLMISSPVGVVCLDVFRFSFVLPVLLLFLMFLWPVCKWCVKVFECLPRQVYFKTDFVTYHSMSEGRSNKRKKKQNQWNSTMGYVMNDITIPRTEQMRIVRKTHTSSTSQKADPTASR